MFSRLKLRGFKVRLVSSLMVILSALYATDVEAQQVTKFTIPDVMVQDQEGRKVRFYSDMIKDKVVVLSFFYTSCTYTCTMQGRMFSKLQSLLGDRLGKSVYLISVTTDPVKDSPEQLRAWAKRYQVKPGWTLVTGDKSELNNLLIQFTGNNAGAEMHLPITFVGNDRKGQWKSAFGVFTPEQLLNVINYVIQDERGQLP